MRRAEYAEHPGDHDVSYGGPTLICAQRPSAPGPHLGYILTSVARRALRLRAATPRSWSNAGTSATTTCASTRSHPDLCETAARRRSARRATEVRMFPRSGPRTDGRCAEGPRVEWLDGEARPTDDPARGAERPARTTPPQPSQKPSLVIEPACALSGLMARPAPRTTPARGAERPDRTTPQQLF